MTEFPALDRLERLASEMSERAASLEQLTSRLDQIEVTVEEADGNVQVTAGPGGHVKRVDLDPRAMRMGSDELGEAITRACARAVTAYEERVAEAMTSLTDQPGEIADALRRALGERQQQPESQPSEAPRPEPQDRPDADDPWKRPW